MIDLCILAAAATHKNSILLREMIMVLSNKSSNLFEFYSDVPVSHDTALFEEQVIIRDEFSLY